MEYLRIIEHTEKLFEILYSKINTPDMQFDDRTEAAVFCAEHIADIMIRKSKYNL